MPNLPQSTKRPWIPERKAFTGISQENYDFYNSAAWRKVSKLYKMANPLCVECKKEGRVTVATKTDHIIPLIQILADKGNPFSYSNLQSLCEHHNAIKTAKQKK